MLTNAKGDYTGGKEVAVMHTSQNAGLMFAGFLLHIHILAAAFSNGAWEQLIQTVAAVPGPAAIYKFRLLH